MPQLDRGHQFTQQPRSRSFGEHEIVGVFHDPIFQSFTDWRVRHFLLGQIPGAQRCSLGYCPLWKAHALLPGLAPGIFIFAKIAQLGNLALQIGELLRAMDAGQLHPRIAHKPHAVNLQREPSHRPAYPLVGQLFFFLEQREE